MSHHSHRIEELPVENTAPLLELNEDDVTGAWSHNVDRRKCMFETDSTGVSAHRHALDVDLINRTNSTAPKAELQAWKVGAMM